MYSIETNFKDSSLASIKSVNRSVDDFSQNDTSKISQNERKLYKTIFYSTRFLIIYLQIIKIKLLSILYLIGRHLMNLWVYISTNNVKYQNILTNSSRKSLEDTKFSLNKDLCVPQNVCITINEEMNSDELFDICYLISDVFFSMPIKSLTFYSFYGKYD